MRYYIAGPMSGYPELNFPEFRRAAAVLKDHGEEPVSPLDLDLNTNAVDNGGADRHIYLREDFRILLDCDAILLLDNWGESVGANAELAVARMLGLSVWRLVGSDIKFSGAHPRKSKLDKAMDEPYLWSPV